MKRKIDIHTHILPKKMPDFNRYFGCHGFVTLRPSADGGADMLKEDGTLFRKIEPNCLEPAVRLAECDANGVAVQVLSTVPIMFSYDAKPEQALYVAQFINDDLAATCAQYPERFIGLGTVPLQDPDLAIKELERCVKELKLYGVQIGSHVGAWNLDRPDLLPFFSAAQDLGASIFVHPWDMMGQEQMQKYWLPWLVGMPAEVSRALCSLIFGGVLEKLPNLRLAFAHGACSFAATIGRIEHGFQCRPDLCAIDSAVNPREYLGRFYVDSLVHDAKALKLIVESFGVDKIALGTDYPFPLGEDRPGKLIEAQDWLSAEDKNKLLTTNALSWLGFTQEAASSFMRGRALSDMVLSCR